MERLATLNRMIKDAGKIGIHSLVVLVVAVLSIYESITYITTRSLSFVRRTTKPNKTAVQVAKSQ